MNALDWLRKAAAQTLDLAAEAYGSLASWCVRTSEQLDPYTADDYRHARHMIDKAAGAFPRAELRDADHTHFATGGLIHPDGTRMDYDGWHYTGPDGSGINIGRPSGDSHEGRGPSYWLDDALKGDPTTWQADHNAQWDAHPALGPEALAEILRATPEPSEQPSGTEERWDGHGDDPVTWMRPAAHTGEHRYIGGICSCGWPTGKHPSETDDE